MDDAVLWTISLQQHQFAVSIMTSAKCLLPTLVAFLIQSYLPAQEIHEWKSKSGHSTRAMFFKIDEQKGKLTLLIPKEIDLDKLDADSIALARKLSNANIEAVKLSETEKPVAESKESEEMQFLRKKYDALTSFKASRDFAEWGFSIGGPYGSWLKELENTKYTSVSASSHVAFAIGHLRQLGLEYKNSKGKETEYAQFANECIKGILSGKPKDEFEKRAVKKIESIMRGGASKAQMVEEQSSQNNGAVYKYVQDDAYPDVYAFNSVAQLKYYWQSSKQSANLNDKQRSELGIELVESRTKILVTSQIPFSSIMIFEYIPTTGRNKGRRLYGTSFDVYDTLR